MIKISKHPKNESKRFRPTESFDVPAEQQHPLFSLRYLQKSHGISNCTQEEKSSFADSLHNLSQLTWGELKQAPRHGLGFEKIPRDHIKKPIPPHIKEDVNFIAFRFCGKAPMVGYRSKAVFHVLWLDRDFTLYDH